MTWLAEKLLFMGGGAFISMVAAYAVISRDLAFQRGQLSQIMQQLLLIQKLQETVVNLDKASVKTQYDLGQAHEKIRKLERREANGGTTA